MHGNAPTQPTPSWPDDGNTIEMTDIRSDEREDVAAATAPLIEPPTHYSGPEEQYHSSGNVFIWLLTIAACVGGLLFGYDTGVISSTLVSIGTDLSHRTLTNTDKGLITASTSFCALIASPVGGWLADHVGRKKVIIYSDVLFTIGAVWQAFSTSVTAMVIGRSVVGLGIGAASMIVPLYIAELAPGSLRGRLTTVQLLFITGGQALAYGIGWGFSAMSGGWRWMVGLGAVPAVTQMVMLAFMPETPRHLVKVNEEQKARQVLERVYWTRQSSNNQSNNDATTNRNARQVNRTLLAIRQEILTEEEAAGSLKNGAADSSRLRATLSSLLFYPPHARALTIACLLQGLQQACGFNSLMYFSATIFSLLGFSNPVLTSLTIALTNFAFTILAFYLIDRLGRRRSLLYTIPVMITSLLLTAAMLRLVTISVDSTETTRSEPQLPHYIILVALMLYVSSYATGLGPVPWQQSELFPLGVRSLGSSLSTATNWGLNTIVGLTFLPMMKILTPTWTFVTYAMVCCVGLVAIWCCYPETTGLEIEEIGHLLQDGWGVEQSMERLKSKRQQDSK